MNRSRDPIYVPWLASAISPFSGFRVFPSDSLVDEDPVSAVAIMESTELGLARVSPNGFYGVVVSKGFFDEHHALSGGCHSFDIEFNATLLREDIPGNYLDLVRTDGIEVCL